VHGHGCTLFVLHAATFLLRVTGVFARVCVCVCSPATLGWRSLLLSLSTGIDYTILGAMALGKAIVFCIAVAFPLLADKSPSKLSKSGVYAVFVTQSNDIGAVVHVLV